MILDDTIMNRPVCGDYLKLIFVYLLSRTLFLRLKREAWSLGSQCIKNLLDQESLYRTRTVFFIGQFFFCIQRLCPVTLLRTSARLKCFRLILTWYPSFKVCCYILKLTCQWVFYVICNSFRNVCILLCPELPNMFSESSPPLPWDGEHNYARDVVEVYYEVSHFTWLWFCWHTPFLGIIFCLRKPKGIFIKSLRRVL